MHFFHNKINKLFTIEENNNNMNNIVRNTENRDFLKMTTADEDWWRLVLGRMATGTWTNSIWTDDDQILNPSFTAILPVPIPEWEGSNHEISGLKNKWHNIMNIFL